MAAPMAAPRVAQKARRKVDSTERRMVAPMVHHWAIQKVNCWVGQSAHQKADQMAAPMAAPRVAQKARRKAGSTERRTAAPMVHHWAIR